MRLATPVTSYSLNSTSIGMANGMRVPTFSNSPTCVGIRHNLTLRERILYRIFYTSRPSSALQYLRVLTSRAACFSRVLDMSLKQKGPFSFIFFQGMGFVRYHVQYHYSTKKKDRKCMLRYWFSFCGPSCIVLHTSKTVPGVFFY